MKLFFLVIFVFVAVNGHSEYVRFFRRPNFTGSAFSVPVGKTCDCINLPPNESDSASSLKPLGNCVYMFSQFNCHGKSGRMDSKSPPAFKRNLGKLKLNNQVSSVKSCNLECLSNDNAKPIEPTKTVTHIEPITRNITHIEPTTRIITPSEPTTRTFTRILYVRPVPATNNEAGSDLI